MSSYTPHMSDDQELYRGVLEYEETPMHYVPNPDYDPRIGMRNSQGVNTWSVNIYVPTGDPDETKTDIIGPYNSVGPIKAYITRHRKRYKNLRLVRVEKVTGWEEVSI